MSPHAESPVPAHLGWRTALGAGALYAFAFVLVSWPLLRHPGTSVLDTVSLYGPAAILIQRDINLTMWTLAWVSHALVTQPLHLFNANVLWPAPYSLATTEHMLGNAPFFTPIYLTTGNPVLAHQLTLVASFAVAGVTLAAWTFHWTRDRPSAIAAGFGFAFAPFRFWQLGNLHVISIGWLPLVLLGIDVTLDDPPGRRGPLLLAAGLLLSTLCSYYIGYSAFALAGLYLLVRLPPRGREALPTLRPLAASFGVSALVVGLLTVPYVLLQKSGILPDYTQQGRISLAFLGMLKYGPLGLLSWYVWPRHDGIPQFLTFAMLAVAAVALVGWRRSPRGALVAAAVGGAVLSLGPRLITRGWTVALPYRWLMLVVPGFSAMRVPQRFGALPTLAVAALAGLGLATARDWLRRRGLARVAAALPIVVVAAMLFESTPRGLAPYVMRVGANVPPAYRWLAEHGDHGPLVELPASRGDLQQQSVYTYYSTFHWLPLVNGYSAYPPKPFVDVMTAAEHLPDPAALRAILVRVPIRWVLLHRDAIQTGNRVAWEQTFRSLLRPVEDFGDAILFEVPGANLESRR